MSCRFQGWGGEHGQKIPSGEVGSLVPKEWSSWVLGVISYNRYNPYFHGKKKCSFFGFGVQRMVFVFNLLTSGGLRPSEFGEMIPFWRAYVSNGLVQPPTRQFVEWFDFVEMEPIRFHLASSSEISPVFNLHNIKSFRPKKRRSHFF